MHLLHRALSSTHPHTYTFSFLFLSCKTLAFFYFEFLYLGVISIECTLHVALQVDTAFAGEIVSLAGSNGAVTDTVCAPERSEPLPALVGHQGGSPQCHRPIE